MKVMLFLGVAASAVVLFFGVGAFREARATQSRAAVVSQKIEALNKEKAAWARLKESAVVDMETLYGAWIKDVSLLASVRRVSLSLEMKDKGSAVEEAFWPGVQRRKLNMVFSEAERASDVAGILAGIDALSVEAERFPVTVDEVRLEKNRVFVEVSLLATATGEKDE